MKAPARLRMTFHMRVLCKFIFILRWKWSASSSWLEGGISVYKLMGCFRKLLGTMWIRCRWMLTGLTKQTTAALYFVSRHIRPVWTDRCWTWPRVTWTLLWPALCLTGQSRNRKYINDKKRLPLANTITGNTKYQMVLLAGVGFRRIFGISAGAIKRMIELQRPWNCQQTKNTR